LIEEMRGIWSSLQGRLSQRLFCRAAKTARSTVRYEKRPELEFDRRVREVTVELAWKRTEAGSPMMTHLLRRLGYPINHKRIERIWEEESLQVPRKRPRKRVSGTPWQRDVEAKRPNDVWCYDFLFERTRRDLKLKVLTVVDEYTRECLAVEVDERIDSEGVKAVLAGLMETRGAPTYVRSDNGSEFKAKDLQKWLVAQGTTPMYIDPGSPWQNGYAESFNGTLRRECLDRETFGSRLELQVVANWWRQYYNAYRPHSSLGYKTPSEISQPLPGGALEGRCQCSLN
jgi:putative transposase